MLQVQAARAVHPDVEHETARHRWIDGREKRLGAFERPRRKAYGLDQPRDGGAQGRIIIDDEHDRIWQQIDLRDSGPAGLFWTLRHNNRRHFIDA